MSFANFGIGLAGLASGLNQGLDSGMKIQKIRDQNQVRDAMKEGLGNAQAARQADAAGRVRRSAVDSEAGPVPTFEVDGKQYGDEKGAMAAAEKSVGGVMGYFYQKEAPRIAELYVQQGDITKAEAWDKWIKDKDVQRGVESGVRAYQAAVVGDDEKAMKHLFDLYNKPGYYDDGLTAKSWAPIKNKAGETTGYAITIAGPDGAESVMNVNKGEDFLNSVQALANPQSVYEQGWKDVQSAKQARLDLARGELEHSRNLEVAQVKANTQADLEDRKQGNRIELEGVKSQLNEAKPSAVEQKAAGLQKVGAQLGMSGEALKGFVTQGLGAKSDDDFVKLATSLLSKQQDMMGNNKFLSLPPAEQQAQIQQLAGTIKAAQGGSSPMAGGIPAPQKAPLPNGAVVLDMKTGKLVPY